MVYKKKKMKKSLYTKHERTEKEITKLKTAYKKGELNFKPDEIAKAILEDKHFKRGFIKE